jgi:maltoporin
MTGPTYKGTMYSYNNMTGIGDKWSVEPSIRYYVQNDTSGGSSERLTPGVRLSYKYNKKITAETEFTYEKSRQESTLNKQDATRYNYYFGLRYDF